MTNKFCSVKQPNTNPCAGSVICSVKTSKLQAINKFNTGFYGT